jgi:hypothetical protein
LPSDHPTPVEGRLAVTLESDTLSATGVVERIDLNNVAAAISGVSAAALSVPDLIALQNQKLRETVAKRVMRAFLLANGVTLAGLTALAVLDQLNLAGHLITPGERIIGGQVIMALLGATTVQVGAIVALIARHLFPARG